MRCGHNDGIIFRKSIFLSILLIILVSQRDSAFPEAPRNLKLAQQTSAVLSRYSIVRKCKIHELPPTRHIQVLFCWKTASFMLAMQNQTRTLALRKISLSPKNIMSSQQMELPAFPKGLFLSVGWQRLDDFLLP